MTCCSFIGNLPPGGGAGGPGGSLYPDPWEIPTGDEVFSDDFENFSGYTVYNNNDTTSTPSVDGTASPFRAKGANPVIDSTTRDRGLIIMPENNTSNGITIARDISSVLNPAQDWTIVAKMAVPNHRLIANNSVIAGVGLTLPATSLWNNSVMILSVETDTTDIGMQSQRVDNNVFGEITQFNLNPNAPTYPNGVLLILYHENGAGTVHGFFSIDGGRSLSELGTMTKDPATFTHLFFWFSAIKQLVTYQQIGLDFVRIYQSIEQR